MKTQSATPQVRFRLLMVAVFLACATTALAVPFHTPTVDGIIARDAVDWDPADLVVDDSADDDIVTRQGNVRRLLLTWDQDNLYLGVTYQDFTANDALSVFVDLDRGVGPTSAAALDSAAGAFTLPDGHHIDLVIRRDPAEAFPGSAPRVFLVDEAGVCSPISDLITVAQAYDGGAKDASAWPLWDNAEFALPWSVIYPDGTGGMPANAVIKAVAVATAGAADLNGVDSAPDNAGLDRGTGVVTLANLHASVVDVSGDGVPDAADASIAGTATLPADAGTARLRVQAELLDFAGRDPGGPVSAIVTAPGERAWTLPRLPAGRYRVTISATGYFPETVEIDVAAGQAVTGVDRTLTKTTSVSGVFHYERGVIRPTTLALVDGGGDVLDSVAISADATPFTLYVQDSGDYTLTASAADYYDLALPVTVVAGTDLTGLDAQMALWTEISGEVVYVGGTPRPGQIELTDAAGARVGIDGFSSVDRAFRFFVENGGAYTLTTSTQPDDYVEVAVPLDVVQDVDLTGLVVEMPVKTQVDAALAFEGPDAEATWDLYYADSGQYRDGGTWATATTIAAYLAEGDYRLHLAGPGYVGRDVLFSVTGADTSLGTLRLDAVRATHLEIVDDDGNTLPEVKATYYDRDGGDPWTASRVLLAARDDAGRDDLYDLDSALTGFRLSARKMDDLSPPTGDPVFYASPSQADVDSVVDFTAGRAGFWMSDTAVEVLRVYLAQPEKDPIAGRIIVAFQDPQPTSILLTADADSLVADGEQSVTVWAQLYDSAGNESLLDGVPVTFAFSADSGGRGQFETPTVLTNGDGLANARLTATGAGPLLISATAVIGNRVLASESAAGREFLTLTALSGETAGWRLSLPASVASLATPVKVTAQLVDAFGNATRDQGRTVLFGADPAGFGAFEPLSATTDTSGRATAVFTPSGNSGLVSFTAEGGGLAGDAIGLELRDVKVVPDPVWYEEPAGHHTFDKTDLTALVIDNTPTELILETPFASDWNGLQLHVIFETGFDAAGAARDPFEQPVNYGHADKPDYALTSKYSADDYGDFRRWDPTGSRWLFWDLTNEVFTDAAADQNIQGPWVTKGADKVVFRLPWTAFGGAPDSLRMEIYLTQDDGEKRAAFDSAPQDATLNLDFDYLDPPEGAWDIALGPTTLTEWSATYVVKTDFPTPPAVSDVVATPANPTAGDAITLQAAITDGGDGIGDVLADLTAMGGGRLTRMYDDGLATHGDATAGDGIYSLMTTVPVGNPGGRQTLVVNAYDAANTWPLQGSTGIDVTPIVEPIVQVTDPVGDDHGANQPGVARKYITYPSNIAFVPGAFDLTGLTIFETSVLAGGQVVDMIAFQVGIADFPDPTDPGTADWNPLYADLNIEKIDILIDSRPGGATASLPNRIAAFERWDAWEYAIVMDGWYKAVIPSFGQNTLDSWRENALRADKDIILLGDPELDTVTALVAKSALGDPTPEEIRAWDIAVCMSSHDFGGEEVLGGIRWVNEFRSEWNFGGGREGNDDPNLIDLLLVPGTGHDPGDPQETILDYEKPSSIARREAGETPVAIMMSRFEDTGPPVIDTGSDGSVVTRVTPLLEAPLTLSMRISDDNEVAAAKFRYRSTGYEGEGWQYEVDMGYVGRDLWVVDIQPTFLDSLVVSPIDGTRYLEFEVWAEDVPSGEPAVAKQTTTPVTTLEIFPAQACLPSDTDLAAEIFSLLQVDGSTITVGAPLSRWLLQQHVAEAWPDRTANPDTMGAHVEFQWDVCNVPAAAREAPTVPPARPIGVFREIYLATADTLGGLVDHAGPLEVPVQLGLHYPRAWLPAGASRDNLAVYRYTAESNRWVLVGGNVGLTGNNVTAAVPGTGTYGLFLNDAVTHDDEEVISGVMVSPNPFSPNGDGLYDECAISFYLNREVTVSVEVFNIDGKRKNVLLRNEPFAGPDSGSPPRRIPGLIWDGTDFSGEVVPYGIYIVRIEANYDLDGTQRAFRENFSVAVIK